MSLPWVSQRAFQEECARASNLQQRAFIAEAEAERLRLELRDLRQKYDALAAEQNYTKRRAIRAETRDQRMTKA